MTPPRRPGRPSSRWRRSVRQRRGARRGGSAIGRPGSASCSPLRPPTRLIVAGSLLSVRREQAHPHFSGTRGEQLLPHRLERVDEAGMVGLLNRVGDVDAHPLAVGGDVLGSLGGADRHRPGRAPTRSAIRRGENVSSITPHTLRRTVGSYLLSKGLRLEVVSKLLGHSSTMVTERACAELLGSTIRDELLALLDDVIHGSRDPAATARRGERRRRERRASQARLPSHERRWSGNSRHPRQF